MYIDLNFCFVYPLFFVQIGQRYRNCNGVVKEILFFFSFC